VQQERMRLMGVIAEAKERITELQGQITADELRIEALDAYDQAKGGKLSGESSRKHRGVSACAQRLRREK
jgi:hypothetical protein